MLSTSVSFLIPPNAPINATSWKHYNNNIVSFPTCSDLIMEIYKWAAFTVTLLRKPLITMSLLLNMCRCIFGGIESNEISIKLDLLKKC